MESLQEMMAAVMARQAIEDRDDTFARDLKAMANRVAYDQDVSGEDDSLVSAAKLYITWETS